MTHDPIAYTYDADIHCPACAFARFGRDEFGDIPENAEDFEGNPIGAIAPWDDWCHRDDDGPEILACGDCREIIETCPPSDEWVSRMVDGYAECAVWSSLDWDDMVGGNPRPMDDEHSTDDLAEETLDEFRSDCEAFARDDAADLVGTDAGQAGHDFWLTRNHHGAGFWDRGLGARGERLTQACRPYGTVDLFVDADGSVRVG